MKLEKDTVQRRVDLMAEEGVRFVTGTEIGHNIVSTMGEFDATVLAIGSTVPNNLPIPGRDLDGIVYAMEFLTQNQTALFANPAAKATTTTTPEVGLTSKYDGKFISAAGKNVIVIGGGDTGTDCIGTSLRHGCNSLTNFELFPAPPAERAESNPWPLWPRIMRVDYGHEEAALRFGADPRSYSILSKEFVSDGFGKVKAVRTVNISVGADGRFQEVAGSEKEWPADLVILAMGFRHPEQTVVQALDLQTDARNNAKASTKDYRTSSKGVFAAGDCRRGQSLVVWAINEGRGVAKVRKRRLRLFSKRRRHLPPRCLLSPAPHEPPHHRLRPSRPSHLLMSAAFPSRSPAFLADLELRLGNRAAPPPTLAPDGDSSDSLFQTHCSPPSFFPADSRSTTIWVACRRGKLRPKRKRRQTTTRNRLPP
jgi:NADPH-dependent glutamate synthase beta subunit-like oxidoreductase